MTTKEASFQFPSNCFCHGTGFQQHFTSKDEFYKRKCIWCATFLGKAPCPYEADHKDPDATAFVGETRVGRFVDELGKTHPSRSTTKTVPYSQWEGRCHFCFPR